MKSKEKQPEKSKAKKNKRIANPFDLNRISEDITALRTALSMQASLLSDIERTLKLPHQEPLIPR